MWGSMVARGGVGVRVPCWPGLTWFELSAGTKGAPRLTCLPRCERKGMREAWSLKAVSCELLEMEPLLHDLGKPGGYISVF